MTVYYFDSEAAAGGAGTQVSPYRDPGDLPSPWVIAGGNSYLFRRGRRFNFSTYFGCTAYTASAIVIGAWGDSTAARPVIRRVRMINRSECVECDVATTGTAATTVPPAGGAGSTNLWRVPKQFYGLFGGMIWGVRCDIAGSVSGATHSTPSAAREWGRCDLSGTNAGYHVIYSVGNPVDTYGGLYANTVSDSDFNTVYTRAAIYVKEPGGGLTVSDVDFDCVDYGLRVQCGASTGLLSGLEVYNSNATNAYWAYSIVGDNSMTSGNGFTGAYYHDLYGENLGSALFATLGSGVCLNKLRVTRNVINGFCKAEGSGGVYIQFAYTTDGDRMIVERNSASGCEYGHFFPSDGYPFYQENSTESLEFRWNFAWNNEGPCYHSNIPHANNVFRQNVGIARASGDAAVKVFHTGGSNASAVVTLIGNIAIGFNRFCLMTNGALGKYNIWSNVSRATTSAGGSNTNAVRTGGYSAACVSVIGNSFYGHDYLLYDGTGAIDHSADATGSIATDPAAELARIPVPTDPTVNYALMISPNFWNGTVDLRPGTRLVI